MFGEIYEAIKGTLWVLYKKASQRNKVRIRIDSHGVVVGYETPKGYTTTEKAVVSQAIATHNFKVNQKLGRTRFQTHGSASLGCVSEFK